MIMGYARGSAQDQIQSIQVDARDKAESKYMFQEKFTCKLGE